MLSHEQALVMSDVDFLGIILIRLTVKIQETVRNRFNELYFTI